MPIPQYQQLTGGMTGANADFYNRGLPQVTPITGSQSTAIGSNISALPDIRKLTEMMNEINLTAQQRSNAGRIPGGPAMETTSSTNIASLLGGNVPKDVINQLGQQSAERGIMTGSPSGPSTNADYLRSLGLTSLNLMGTGQDWFSQATARNPGAPLFDPSTMFLTPAQQAQLELERERLAIARQQANQSRLGGGGYGGGFGGGRGFGGGSTIGGGVGTMPNLFNTTPTGGGVGSSWQNLSGPMTDNWLDQVLWDNSTPFGVSGAFDYGSTNWADSIV